jgi:hypothetical protein
MVGDHTHGAGDGHPEKWIFAEIQLKLNLSLRKLDRT